MRITHNKDKSTTRYKVSGTELRSATNYKDLGVIMAIVIRGCHGE